MRKEFDKYKYLEAIEEDMLFENYFPVWKSDLKVS